MFQSVRFYNVDTWAAGTQVRRHICDYRFKLFMEKNVEKFCFGECTFPEAPSDWRDHRWCLIAISKDSSFCFLCYLLVEVVGREQSF